MDGFYAAVEKLGHIYIAGIPTRCIYKNKIYIMLSSVLEYTMIRRTVVVVSVW
jgi:hypothetical protein